MTSSISNVDKKIFIRWFLKNHQLKRREGVWILNFLLTSDKLLRKVHFIDDAHYCPRAIVMSTVDSMGIPFRFYKDNMMTNDAEKAFFDMKNNTQQDLFIQINFSNVPPNANYLAVVEENPYVPKNLQSSVSTRQIAEQAVITSIHQFQEKYLLEQIDSALDNGDEALFHELVKELKNLQ